MISLPVARLGALFTAAFAGVLLSATLPADAMSYSVIYRFQGGTTDGYAPYSAVINLSGKLYGTTDLGGGTGCGGFGCGTFFSVTTAGHEHVVYSFQGGSDGANPGSAPANVSGTLYGTTTYGGGSGCGGSGCGTVYTVTTGGSESPFYSFKGGSDGANPLRGAVAVGTNLYGTTEEGGSACGGVGCGTVYSLNTTTKSENWVYSFKAGSDGSSPLSRLTKVGSLLYGTTSGGGSCGCGTVFSISTSGAESVVYSFKGGSDGQNPVSGLTNVNGTLYGTTSDGGGTGCGGSGCGIVYSLNLSTHSENWVYAFAGGNDGWGPGYSVLLNKKGTLYGTTQAGGGTGCGGSGCGTVFSITTAGQGEKVVYAFQGGSDGVYPEGSLSNVNGSLYGTTAYGGSTTGCFGSGCGTVFKLKP